MSEMEVSTEVEMEEFLKIVNVKITTNEMSYLMGVMERLDPAALENSKFYIGYQVVGGLVDIYSITSGTKSLIEAAIAYNKAETDVDRQVAAADALVATFDLASCATGFSLMTSYFSYVFDMGAHCLATGYEIVSKYKKRLLMLEELMNEGIKKKDITELAEGDEDLKELAQLSKDLKELARFSELLECNSDSQGVNSEIARTMALCEETYELQAKVVTSITLKLGESYIDMNTVPTEDMGNASVEVGTAEKTAVDPIVLDIDGDGFDIEKKVSGTYFDLNCDGFAERINWTREDAILTLDKNSNGVVDDGREVFGDYHLLANGTRAKNGFEALAQYDTNGDGVIDAKDDVFDKLKLWVDADGDGVSVTGELKTLKEMGIKAIHLNYNNLLA